MIRHVGALHDDRTFHLTGDGVNGNWYLAKVLPTDKLSSYDYETQVYARADLSDMKLFPEVLAKFSNTVDDLVVYLKKLNHVGLTTPDKYLLRVDAKTFSELGFDVS